MISKTVKHKPIINKLMSYIIRAVLHSAIEYKTQEIYLNKSEVDKLDNKIRTVFYAKANISKTIGFKTIYYPDFYKIPKFENLQFMARMLKLLYDLNSPNLKDTITKARMSQYQ